MSLDIKSEEKIWYDYQTEVFNKLPPMKNPLKPIPMKFMKRIAKRWVSVESVLKLLEERENEARTVNNTGEAYVYKKIGQEVYQALYISLNSKNVTQP